MSIREGLALYKDGKLGDEARARVEEIIDVHEAVSEYLMDRDLGRAFPDDDPVGEAGADFPGNTAPFADDPAPADDAERAFERAVTARIRAAFAKAGLITAGAVIALLLLAAAILPRLVDAFYYDPLAKTESAVGNTENALSADLSAFTELFRPDYYRTYATAERLGYGAYELCIYDLEAQTPTRTVGTLRKNKLLLYDGTVLCPLFGRFSGRPQEADIAPDKYYEVTFRLSDTDYAALGAALAAAGVKTEGLWVAVADTGFAGDIGFFAQRPDGTLLTPEEARTHFEALLSYLSDRPRFLLLTQVSAAELTGPKSGELGAVGFIARMSGADIERLRTDRRFTELDAVAVR